MANLKAAQESLLFLVCVWGCCLSHNGYQVWANDCPSYPSKVAFNISKDFLDQMYIAANLSVIVEREISPPIEEVIQEQRETNYELFNGWSDFRDQTLVAKRNGTCYAAFMGIGSETWGSIQSLNPIPREVNGCSVRRAWWTTYNSITYRDKFNHFLKTCLSSCGDDEPCPLVLTGFSKGGAGATVAALDLDRYKPTVITFGASKAVLQLSECETIDPKRHFRFIVTDDNGEYDRVPMYTNFFLERHYGWPLLLDGINWPICTPGLNDSKSRAPQCFLRNPTYNTPLDRPDAVRLHEIGFYLDRIVQLQNGGCFPVPVSRWPAGHYCNYDDECFNDCKNKVCT
jgi:hypothetical protein